MSTDIDFRDVTIEGSPVIYRHKLGQYQLLVTRGGKVYSMTTSWEPALLFEMEMLDAMVASTRPQLVTTNPKEH